VACATRSATLPLAALKSIRAARSDDDWSYVILDNLSAHKLSAHKGPINRDWAHRNNVESCFTPDLQSLGKLGLPRMVGVTRWGWPSVHGPDGGNDVGDCR